MTAPLAVFFVLAALAVIGAVSLILQKHPIHSALSLIVVMIALAGLYLLLGAEFVAAVQIIVYGGAIMVLFVIVIMLLNAGVEEHTSGLRGGDDSTVDGERTGYAANRRNCFDIGNFEHDLQRLCVSVRADVLPDSRGGAGGHGAGPAGEELRWCRQTIT